MTTGDGGGPGPRPTGGPVTGPVAPTCVVSVRPTTVHVGPCRTSGGHSQLPSLHPGGPLVPPHPKKLLTVPRPPGPFTLPTVPTTPLPWRVTRSTPAQEVTRGPHTSRVLTPIIPHDIRPHLVPPLPLQTPRTRYPRVVGCPRILLKLDTLRWGVIRRTGR